MSKQRRQRTRAWYQKHVNDPFVKQSQAEGFRSRAAYKLMELDDKYHFIKRGACVLELGAAPGSWSQVLVKRVGAKGQVIGVDLLAIEPLNHVTFIQGDILAEGTQTQIAQALEEAQVSLVLSDIAPNLSGVGVADIARQLAIAEQVFDSATQWLEADGTLVLKFFQGEGTDEFLQVLRKAFKKVIMRKPDASRPKSREFYILATGYKPPV